jgi:hypothetical protein
MKKFSLWVPILFASVIFPVTTVNAEEGVLKQAPTSRIRGIIVVTDPGEPKPWYEPSLDTGDTVICLRVPDGTDEGDLVAFELTTDPAGVPVAWNIVKIAEGQRITGFIDADITMDGNRILLLDNAWVNGSIKVQGGNTLVITGGSTVTGETKVENIRTLVCTGNNQINESLKVDGSLNITISSNTIGEDMKVDGSQNATIQGNNINGDLKVEGVSSQDIFGNVVGGKTKIE